MVAIMQQSNEEEQPSSFAMQDCDPPNGMAQAVHWLQKNLRVPFVWSDDMVTQDSRAPPPDSTASPPSPRAGTGRDISTDVALYLPGNVYWIEEEVEGGEEQPPQPPGDQKKRQPPPPGNRLAYHIYR